jgi:hypothetical protein
MMRAGKINKYPVIPSRTSIQRIILPDFTFVGIESEPNSAN